MARKYSQSLREAAARSIMRRRGWEYQGDDLMDDRLYNPRVADWVADADAVLAVVFPRTDPEANSVGMEPQSGGMHKNTNPKESL